MKSSDSLTITSFVTFLKCAVKSSDPLRFAEWNDTNFYRMFETVVSTWEHSDDNVYHGIANLQFRRDDKRSGI